jgi:hypothetical protein
MTTTIRNGWLVCGDEPLIGMGHETDGWGGLRKSHTPPGWIQPWRQWVFDLQPLANITRDFPGEVGPGKTEDLPELAAAMEQLGMVAYEHYYGLWYDRRRDMHDPREKRPPVTNSPANPWDNPVAPFFAQPWARSGEGVAYDGESLYDLGQFDDWYFQRLGEFASLCDQHHMLFLHGHHNQHTILENSAQYADYAWNPANCIQRLPMPPLPETICICAARAFYDIAEPTKRRLHRAYIRHCLDALSDSPSVIHKHGAEYTGPLTFTQFWLDTIIEWKRETGKDAKVCLCATKDVTDAILADEVRAEHVDAIDLRMWWYRADGTLLAPAGGQDDQPGRYQGQIAETTATQLHRQALEYRLAHPNKALLHSIHSNDLDKLWAILTGGVSINIDALDPLTPESTYETLAGGAVFAPSRTFLREHVGATLIDMQPMPIAVNRPDVNWCLADVEGRHCLLYASAGGAVELSSPAALRGRWFNPTTGELTDAGPSEAGGEMQRWHAPNPGAVLWATDDS